MSVADCAVALTSTVTGSGLPLVAETPPAVMAKVVPAKGAVTTPSGTGTGTRTAFLSDQPLGLAVSPPVAALAPDAVSVPTVPPKLTPGLVAATDWWTALLPAHVHLEAANQIMTGEEAGARAERRRIRERGGWRPVKELGVGADHRRDAHAGLVGDRDEVGRGVDVQHVSFGAQPDVGESTARPHAHGNERAVALVARRDPHVFAGQRRGS